MVCVLLFFSNGFLSVVMDMLATGLFIVVSYGEHVFYGYLCGFRHGFASCWLLMELNFRILVKQRVFVRFSQSPARFGWHDIFALCLFKLSFFQAATVDKRRISFNGCYLVPRNITFTFKTL
ncbi:hypothetical protein HA466_0016980 [Hirschfeldia incana]|nr:hypothetical protein HA466_0016980 [Hirschfeldia incana]